MLASGTIVVSVPGSASASTGLGRKLFFEPFRAHQRTEQVLSMMLGPIDASISRLSNAYALVSGMEPDYARALDLVRRAGDNCYLYDLDEGSTLEERVSQIQQTKELAEVCTFRVVIKNILLTQEEEPLRAQAYAAVDTVQRDLEALDHALVKARASTAPDQASVRDQFQVALASFQALDKATRRCLA